MQRRIVCVTLKSPENAWEKSPKNDMNMSDLRMRVCVREIHLINCASTSATSSFGSLSFTNARSIPDSCAPKRKWFLREFAVRQRNDPSKEFYTHLFVVEMQSGRRGGRKRPWQYHAIHILFEFIAFEFVVVYGTWHRILPRMLKHNVSTLCC